MTLYKEKIAQYAPATPMPATASSRTAGRAARARSRRCCRNVEDPNRLGVMQTARTLTDLTDIGLQLPDSTWTVDADDWFLGENFDLVQYSTADGYFKPVGELLDVRRRDRGDHAREPDQRLSEPRARSARASGSVTTSRPSRVVEPVAVAAVQVVARRRTG